MNCHRLRGIVLMLCTLGLLVACATPPPAVDSEAPPERAAERVGALVKVDESSMLPLLGYLQHLGRLSAAELARERRVLAAIPPTPSRQVRQAMVLGQPRGAIDLPRALGLLDKVLKSNEPTAASLHPLALMLATQYQDRQKFQTQSDKLVQQLNDSLRHSAELQLKLDALADIERSLPVRPTGGENAPGAAR